MICEVPIFSKAVKVRLILENTTKKIKIVKDIEKKKKVLSRGILVLSLARKSLLYRL